MVNYIKQFIRDFSEKKPIQHAAPYREQFWSLGQELSRLDPRDFDPIVQAEFLHLRTTIMWLGNAGGGSDNVFMSICGRLLTVLDQYRGRGSGGSRRSFPHISDPDLLRIIERDYAEVSNLLYPSGAWKSTVILAGSILEAILFAHLSSPAWNAQALASSNAPKYKGTVVPMGEWKLVNLIDVSVTIGRLPKDPADTIHQVLRDYRNFVHPKKEIRAAHACTEAEAMLAVGALNSVCNYFDANP